MKQSLSRILSALLVLLLLGAGLAQAAPEVPVPGEFPLLKEKVALNLGIVQNANVENLDTNKYTLLLEERVGVDLNFTVLPATDAAQKFALMVAGGSELPDVLVMGLNDNDVVQYGTQGTFIALNELYDTYANYITTALANNNDTTTLPMVTMSDGKIYSVPYMNCVYANDWSYLGWINQTWLDTLGLEMPETTEDYYQVLKAFKDQDPNGNGKPDEIPLVGQAPTVQSGFGFANPFVFLMNAFIYTDPNYLLIEDGKIDVAYNKAEWRAGLEYMNKLVSEDLLSPLSYTQDQSQLKALLDFEDAAIVGSFMNTSWAIYKPGSERKMDMVAMEPLTGPEGVQYATFTPAAPSQRYFITKDCQNPEAAFILGDYMLSEEASIWARFGEPVVDYEIVDPSLGVSYRVNPNVKLVLKPILVWGSVQNAHWNEAGPKYRAYTDIDVAWAGDEYDQSYVKANALVMYMDKGPEAVTGKILYTLEEQEQLKDITGTLKSFVEETAVRLITGNESFAFWDAYLNELEVIGLSRYLEITQTAYDRMHP